MLNMNDPSFKTRLLQRLKANSDLFRLFDSLPDVCFFAKDRRGRFIMGNRAFLEKLGLDREEDLIGKDDFDFFPERLVEIFLRDDQRVIRTGEPLIDRVELVSNSEGSIDWHITTKVPLVSRNNHAVGIAGITRDFRRSGERWRPHQQFAAVIDHIDQNYSQPIQVEELASLMYLSVNQFERKFKQVFQVSPVQVPHGLPGASRLLRPAPHGSYDHANRHEKRVLRPQSFHPAFPQRDGDDPQPVPTRLKHVVRGVNHEEAKHRDLRRTETLRDSLADRVRPLDFGHLGLFRISRLRARIPCLGAFRSGGLAVRDVTPEPLLPVSGGVGPSHPVTRKIGQLTVRALVLENDGTRVAICSTDFLGFPARSVRQGPRPGPGHPAAEHPHRRHAHAQRPRLLRLSRPHRQDRRRPRVPRRRLREAGRGDQRGRGRTCSRRVSRSPPARPRARSPTTTTPSKLYDPRCTVIQVLDAAGKPIATLVNYASHPEVIGPDQGIMCPDFVGPLYDRIQERGRGHGHLHEQRPGRHGDRRLPRPQRQGRPDLGRVPPHRTLLADEALRIVADAPAQEDPALFCGSTTVEFPVENEMLRTVVKLSPLGFQLSDKGTVATQVNVVNLGNAQILTIPGEALPNIGFYLKRKMHGEHNLLFGLTNDAFGYILTKVDWNSFERYNYITRTSLGEMTGEILIDKSLAFVESCPRPAALRSK